jgi:hypothetical protein
MHETSRFIETDERFMHDWISFGLREMETLLESHARFDAFCSAREAGFRRLDAAVRGIQGA